MNNDSPSTQEVISFYGTFLLTGLDVLSEAGLLVPSSVIPNIAIITLLILDFVEKHVTEVGYRVNWSHEVVRILDKAGIELKSRKEISRMSLCLSQAEIEGLRKEYKTKEAKKKAFRLRDWKKEVIKPSFTMTFRH